MTLQYTPTLNEKGPFYINLEPQNVSKMLNNAPQIL